MNGERKDDMRSVVGPMIKLHRITPERMNPVWVWVCAFEITQVADERGNGTSVHSKSSMNLNVRESVEQVLDLIEEATSPQAAEPPSAEKIREYVKAAIQMAETFKRMMKSEAASEQGGMPS